VIPATVAEARAEAARLASAPEADWQATSKAWVDECAWLYDLATAGAWDLERALREGAARLLARVLPLPNPKTSGDQILERIALLVPAGSRVTILGAENIRGTGLDFVYRWVSVDKVRGWLSDALKGDVEQAREALAHLGAWDGWGVWDARYAAEILERRGDRAAAVGLEEEWELALETVRAWVTRRSALMRRQREGGATWLDWLRRFALDADIVGSVRRRWKADRLYRDLMRLDVGRARAADEVRRLLDAERA
jgi:hypothetical protein